MASRLRLHLLVEDFCFWKLLLQAMQLCQVVACASHMGVILPKSYSSFLQGLLEVGFCLRQLFLQVAESCTEHSKKITS